MKAFKLVDKDIIFKNGRIETVEGVECLAQRLCNAIKLDKGSWFLDVGKGIEWVKILGYKTISMRFIYSRIQNILKSDSEVKSINYINIEVEREKRVMKVIFSVDSIYGEAEGGEWITG